METELDKLDSYLKEHYLNIEDSVYLFFKWILENRDIVVRIKNVGPMTLYQYNNYIEHMGLPDTEEIKDEFKQIYESIYTPEYL
jgi:hypothetical protein